MFKILQILLYYLIQHHIKNKKMRRLTILIIACLFVKNFAFAQTETPTFDKIYQRKIPTWFNEAKFGVFIVWGIYSVPGWAPKGQYAEWYGSNSRIPGSDSQKYHDKVWGKDFNYGQFVPLFTGEAFNAEEWASLIKKSGAKYVVTCANYHDGFAMYPTKYSNSEFGDHWNAFESGPKRDVLGELNTAGTAKGLQMGIYYSIYEWRHPLYKSGQIEKYAREHFQPKFKEVITKYKPKVIFLDGEWEQSYKTWHSEEVANWLYTESPVKDEVVVNDRWGWTRSQYGDYYSSEYGGGDYSPAHPWQEDRGIGKSYGYNRNEDAWDYNTKNELLTLLSTVCSNGGNLLLDIGPTADGHIPPIMQERLLQIGEWLNKNGESIYGTSASPFWPRKFEWGVCTGKKKTIYLHLFDQKKANIEIQGIENEIESVKYLATGENLKFTKSKEDLQISLTPVKPDVDITVIAVTLKGEAKTDKRPHQYESSKIIIPAWSLKINGSSPKMLFDGFEKIAHIGNWTGPKDYLSCQFVANKPGKYEVSVKYCSDSIAAKSTAKILVNSDGVNFVSENTGGWKGANYQTKRCGFISIPKIGEQSLTITPEQKGWKNMAIKEIIFTPAK
jgi:alpha-L-fucosidase